MTDSPQHSLLLPDVMRNVAVETGRMAEMAQRLDDALSEMADNDSASALQDVDHLRQALEVLTQLSGAMADAFSDPGAIGHSVSVDAEHVGAGLKPQNVRDAFLYGAAPVAEDWDTSAELGFLEL